MSEFEKRIPFQPIEQAVTRFTGIRARSRRACRRVPIPARRVSLALRRRGVPDESDMALVVGAVKETQELTIRFDQNGQISAHASTGSFTLLGPLYRDGDLVDMCLIKP